MPQYSGHVIESQADWLTVSAHGQDRARDMLDLALRLAKEEQAQGNKPSSWRSMGYEGTHVGRVEYGQRDQYSTILRLSGDAADRMFGVAHQLADTVTRLDLAVTWQADPPVPYLGQQAYHQAFTKYKLDKRKARPQFHGDGDGGFDCIVGDRSSEYYFRLYNKEAEERASMGKLYDGRYDACWRYEVELKGTVASQVADLYLDATSRSGFTQRYLYAYCTAHGIKPEFPDIGKTRLVPGFRRRSDADSKLAHLAKNVRPTVDWLREAGREEDLLRVLGLS